MNDDLERIEQVLRSNEECEAADEIKKNREVIENAVIFERKLSKGRHISLHRFPVSLYTEVLLMDDREHTFRIYSEKEFKNEE